MDAETLRKLFPHCSSSFLAENSDSVKSPKPAKPKRNPVPKQVGDNGDKKADSARYVVCYTDVRKRLLDEDNAVSKWHTDCLRRAGIIPDDNPEVCKIIVTQRKCLKGEEPHCLIEVSRE